ncbi:RNA pseudouridylate synthase domain-containing protein 2 isoform X2 [Pseudonaja textilis]|uniref:RNA pseudouridylate synthase domain-containing protein 2 isoform X2 n=1 Tax=Pseudonaja textilis TaxID=8673 RepID=UPI000EA89580|nr:RNA pseudouridylate synthase domain-containing protein 2 isoform X2 [Pseudonaja textilis]
MRPGSFWRTLLRFCLVRLIAERAFLGTLAGLVPGRSMEGKPIPEPKEQVAKKRRLSKGQKKRPGPLEEGEKRYVPPPKKRNTGVSFGEAHFAETSYYFEGGLRKNNDFLENTIHRHEPPVTAQTIEFIEDNDEVVVVDKPSSVPVHPCGGFRHNTIIFILGKEHNLKELHTVHRLDRLTSGVLIFAKSVEVSKRIDEQVRQRQLEKEYVCRVVGEFPENEVICEEPILSMSYKMGLCRVDPKGKPCKTIFQRLSYNGKTSVVKCFPYTGRTHQIRVHLQFLGHPIINDPIYNNDIWGPEKGKGGSVNKTDDELLQSFAEEYVSKESLGILDIVEEDLKAVLADKKQETPDHGTKPLQVTTAIDHSDNVEESEDKAKTLSLNSAPQANVHKTKSGEMCLTEFHNEIDPLCEECKMVRPDPSPRELVMYLHALRYKGMEFEYCSKMPAWAQDDWEET